MSFSLAMLRFWVVDAPGLGMPVSTLPIRAADFYSQRIDGFITWNFAQSFHDGMARPDFLELFRLLHGSGVADLDVRHPALQHRLHRLADRVHRCRARRRRGLRGARPAVHPLAVRPAHGLSCSGAGCARTCSSRSTPRWAGPSWRSARSCSTASGAPCRPVLPRRSRGSFYSAAVLLVAVLSMFKVHSLTNAIFHGGGSFTSGAGALAASAARRLIA